MNVQIADDAEHLSRVTPRNAIHALNLKSGVWIEFGKL